MFFLKEETEKVEESHVQKKIYTRESVRRKAGYSLIIFIETNNIYSIGCPRKKKTAYLTVTIHTAATQGIHFHSSCDATIYLSAVMRECVVKFNLLVDAELLFHGVVFVGKKPNIHTIHTVCLATFLVYRFFVLFPKKKAQ